MGYNRSRSRQIGGTLTGEYWGRYSGTPSYNTVFSGRTSISHDTIGSGGMDHDLFIEHHDYSPWVANYSQNEGEPPNGGVVIKNQPQPAFGGAYKLSHLIKADSSTATDVMARTNPSRAHVSLPNFFSELRELPLLLKTVGTGVLTGVATGNITYKFGLRPLVSDFLKMTEFAIVSKKRMENLKKLQEAGGLKRKVRTSQAYQGGSFERTVGGVLHKVKDTTSSSSWATVRWVPSGSFPDSDEKLDRYVYRSIRGIDPSQLTSVIWEALPWSWLVDWFAEVGDYLVAHNNSVASVAGPICVMTQTVSTRTDFVEHTYLDTFKVTQPSESLTTKERTVKSSSSLPEAHFPVLTGNQLSILGSLAILKGGKR